jgi:hypothetical protein
LEAYPGGLSSDRLVRDAVDALDLRSAGWAKSWRKLTSELPFAQNALSDEEPTAEFKLVEEALAAGVGAKKAPLRSAQAAVELLAVLYQRCATNRQFMAEQLGGAHPDAPVRTLSKRADLSRSKQ